MDAAKTAGLWALLLCVVGVLLMALFTSVKAANDVPAPETRFSLLNADHDVWTEAADLSLTAAKRRAVFRLDETTGKTWMLVRIERRAGTKPGMLLYWYPVEELQPK